MIALDYYLDRATLAEYYYYRWTHPVETLRRRRSWYLFRWTTFYLIVAALSGAYAVDQGVLIQLITEKTETSATVVSRVHWAAPLSFVFLGFAVWLIFRRRKKFEEHLLRQAAGQAFKELHQPYGDEQSVVLHPDRVERKFLGYRRIAAIDCIEEIAETQNAVFLRFREGAKRQFEKIIQPRDHFDTEKWTEIQNWVAARRSAVEEVLEAEPMEDGERKAPMREDSMRIKNPLDKEDLTDFYLWANSATPFLRWLFILDLRRYGRALVILGWLLVPLVFWFGQTVEHHMDVGEEKKTIIASDYPLIFFPIVLWGTALLFRLSWRGNEHQKRSAKRYARKGIRTYSGDQTLELRDDGIAILRPSGYELVIDYDRFHDVIHRKRITILQPRGGIPGSVLVSHEGKSPEEVNRFIDAFRKRCNGLKGAGPVSEGSRRR